MYTAMILPVAFYVSFNNVSLVCRTAKMPDDHKETILFFFDSATLVVIMLLPRWWFALATISLVFAAPTKDSTTERRALKCRMVADSSCNQKNCQAAGGVCLLEGDKCRRNREMMEQLACSGCTCESVTAWTSISKADTKQSTNYNYLPTHLKGI